MKLFSIASLLFVASVSQADIIKCSFTEPFFVTTYSMTQSTLTYAAPQEKDVVIKDVSFQIKDAGKFELVSKEGKVLQTLELNHQGSDGMSDKIYPYDVKDESQVMMANGGFGGCVSNSLKIVVPRHL